VEAERHTPGNAAALREALIKALTLIHVCDWPPGVSLDGVAEVVREIDSALDKPPRQCDVGTAEEQLSRWGVYCKEGKARCLVHGKWRFINCTACFADWAQMPYTKEVGE
jgi:hypothetical protein